MPFKDRMKRAFGRNSSTTGDSLSKASSRKSSNIYQPGEQMPRLKYRQPVDKKHKEHLESFSFGGGNVRRKSVTSNYSPMGSRWPSRRNSIEHGYAPHGYGRIHPPRGLMELDFSKLSISDRKDSADSSKPETHHIENASETSDDTDNITSPVSLSGGARDHTPFSEADLHQALERSTSRTQSRRVIEP